MTRLPASPRPRKTHIPVQLPGRRTLTEEMRPLIGEHLFLSCTLEDQPVQFKILLTHVYEQDGTTFVSGPGQTARPISRQHLSLALVDPPLALR